jgi:hypothetical protein
MFLVSDLIPHGFGFRFDHTGFWNLNQKKKGFKKIYIYWWSLDE